MVYRYVKRFIIVQKHIYILFYVYIDFSNCKEGWGAITAQLVSSFIFHSHIELLWV